MSPCKMFKINAVHLAIHSYLAEPQNHYYVLYYNIVKAVLFKSCHKSWQTCPKICLGSVECKFAIKTHALELNFVVSKNLVTTGKLC